MPWFSRVTGLAVTTEEVASIARQIDQMAWLAQWAPALTRWETHLLLLDVVENPMIVDLTRDVDRVTTTLERFEELTREMPGMIREELSAVLDDIDQRQGEVRQTLAEVQVLATETRETVDTVSQIMTDASGTLETRPELLAAVDDTTAG